MAFAEDGGADLEGLTFDGFGRPSPAVDEGTDVQDGNATDHGITWGLELGMHGARGGWGGLTACAANGGLRPL